MSRPQSELAKSRSATTPEILESWGDLMSVLSRIVETIARIESQLGSISSSLQSDPHIPKDGKKPELPSGGGKTKASRQASAGGKATASSSLDGDDLLTPTQAAEHLQVSRRTLDRLRARRAKLGAIKVGGQIRYDRGILDEYLRKRADK
jgi:excisionase family DNA binding protein